MFDSEVMEEIERMIDKPDYRRVRKAIKIVDRILYDLRNRKGLGQAWDQIDEDIQNEIIDEWTYIVDREIKKDDD